MRESLFPELATYLMDATCEASAIPAQRTAELERLAAIVYAARRSNQTARLVFICTHNSRRSHLAQVWAHTAAFAYGVTGVEAYSGGTETTAFDPRAVAALARAGFRITAGSDSDNPVSRVRYANRTKPIECFSKTYDQPPNPREGFCAIMTCSAADESCPLVVGAQSRISLLYDDPKVFDGTAQETLRYDERCRQIAREMVYMVRCLAPVGEV